MHLSLDLYVASLLGTLNIVVLSLDADVFFFSPHFDFMSFGRIPGSGIAGSYGS